MSPTGTGTELSIAFLGYLASRERVVEDPTLSLADNRMQHGYVSALRAEYDDVSVFSSVPATPQQGPGPVSADDDGVPVRHLGVPLRRLPLTKLVALVRELGTWAEQRADRPKVLVFYNTFLLYCLAAAWLRRRHGVRTVPIAITLPYSAPDTAPTLSGRVQGWLSGRLLRSIDGLVAITPFLAEALNPRVRACVVRGAVLDAELSRDAPPGQVRAVSSPPHRIVYAGNLSQRYNLDAAVAMMDHLPAGDFELHLYGRGALEPLVRAAATRSAAIEFHGAVAEHEVPGILRDASVLLALLSTDDDLARHSFPSKLFESLASGTPVLTTALPTLDPSMLEHVEVVDDLDPRRLAATVVDICSRSPDQARDASAAALTHLRETATWSAVGHRLRNYLGSVEGSST